MWEIGVIQNHRAFTARVEERVAEELRQRFGVVADEHASDVQAEDHASERRTAP
jgi:hypothetical protein